MGKGLLIVLLLAAPIAHAQRPMTQEDEEARELFEAGEVAFEQGRYARAHERFRQAYEVSPRPELLYNIALSAERARMDEEAIAAYEQFLAALPDHAQAGFARNRLAELQGHASGDEAEAAPSGGGESSASSVDPVPIVVIGLAAAVTIGGAIALGIGADDWTRVEGASDGARWEEYRDSYDRAGGLLGGGAAMVALGIAGLVGGAIWMAQPASSGAQTDVAIGPGSVRVRVRW